MANSNHQAPIPPLPPGTTYKKRYHRDANYEASPITLNLFSVYQICDLACASDHTVRLHHQICHEISYIVSGEGVFFRNGKPYNVKPGMVFLVNDQDVHSIRSSKDSPLRFMCLGFAFHKDHPDFFIDSIETSFGRDAMTPEQLQAFVLAHPSDVCSASIPENITLARRIFPADGGEGHFVVRMRRRGERRTTSEDWCLEAAESSVPLINELLDSCFSRRPVGFVHTQGDSIYLLPCPAELISGLPVVRAGVLAGTIEKKRIEPHHALFMSADPENCLSRLELDADSPQLEKFLHGEQLDVSDELRGYTAVLCSGIIVGFGKASGGALKNRYPKGLRLL